MQHGIVAGSVWDAMRGIFSVSVVGAVHKYGHTTLQKKYRCRAPKMDSLAEVTKYHPEDHDGIFVVLASLGRNEKADSLISSSLAKIEEENRKSEYNRHQECNSDSSET